jgi:hypothetical protein
MEQLSHNSSVLIGGAAYASSIPALPPEPAYLLHPTVVAHVLAAVATQWMRA